MCIYLFNLPQERDEETTYYWSNLPKGTETQKIDFSTISWESSSQDKISKERKHTH